MLAPPVPWARGWDFYGAVFSDLVESLLRSGVTVAHARRLLALSPCPSLHGLSYEGLITPPSTRAREGVVCIARIMKAVPRPTTSSSTSAAAAAAAGGGASGASATTSSCQDTLVAHLIGWIAMISHFAPDEHNADFAHALIFHIFEAACLHDVRASRAAEKLLNAVVDMVAEAVRSRTLQRELHDLLAQAARGQAPSALGSVAAVVGLLRALHSSTAPIPFTAEQIASLHQSIDWLISYASSGDPDAVPGGVARGAGADGATGRRSSAGSFAGIEARSFGSQLQADILLAIRKLLQVSPSVPLDRARTWFKEGEILFNSKSSALRIAAIEVMVQCTLLCPEDANMRNSVWQPAVSVLRVAAAVVEPNVAVMRSVLKALHDIAIAIPSTLPGTINAVKDLLLSSTPVSSAPAPTDDGTAAATVPVAAIQVAQHPFRQAAVSILCRLMKHELTTVAFKDSSSQKVINALSNELFVARDTAVFRSTRGIDSSSDGGESDDAAPKFRARASTYSDRNRLVNIIRLAGALAAFVDSEELSTMVVQMLIDQFSRAPQQRRWFFKPLVSVLADTAILTSAQASLGSVLDLFFSAYRRPFDPHQPASTTEMPTAFERIARKLRARGDAPLMKDRLLVMFTQLGLQIQQQLKRFRAQQVTAYAGNLGMLLPALAETLMADRDSMTLLHPKGSTVKSFRNLWFYLVLFRFATGEDLWPADMVVATQNIAACSPVLVTADTTTLGLELASSAIVKHGVSDVAPELRNMLQRAMPQHAGAIRSLVDHDLVFVCSVYYLETIRAGTGTFKGVFSYIADGSIEEGQMSGVIMGVADKAFELFMTEMVARGRGLAREEVLQDHCQFLIVRSSHRYERIRVAARKYLKIMLGVFSQLFWSNKCAFTLLDVMDAVAQRKSMGNQPEAHALIELHVGPRRTHGGAPLSALDESMPLRVRHCPYVLDLPASEESLRIICVEFSDIVTSWLTQASAVSAAETYSLLQSYIAQLSRANRQSVTQRHAGLAAALHAAAPTIHPVLRGLTPNPGDGVTSPAGRSDDIGGFSAAAFGDVPADVMSRARTFAGDVDLRAYYYGQVEGMHVQVHLMKTLARTSGNEILSFVPDLARALVLSLSRLTSKRALELEAERTGEAVHVAHAAPAAAAAAAAATQPESDYTDSDVEPAGVAPLLDETRGSLQLPSTPRTPQFDVNGSYTEGEQVGTVDKLKRAVRRLKRRVRRTGSAFLGSPDASEKAQDTPAAPRSGPQLLQVLQTMESETDMALNKAAQSMLYRAAALIVWAHTRHDAEHIEVVELLRYLAWIPARLFSADVMSAAVFAWNWVLSAVPQERVRLLSEIGSSWSWTVTSRIGLFSGGRVGRDDSPNAKEAQVFEHPSAPCSTPRVFTANSLLIVEPHYIWIKFWHERCRLVQSRSTEEHRIIFVALNVAISDVSRLSLHPSALGARLRLLRMGFDILSTNHTQLQELSKALNSVLERPKEDVQHTSLRLGGVGATLGMEPGLDSYMASSVQRLSDMLSGTPLKTLPPSLEGDVWTCTAVGSLALLRERLYRVALHWFEAVPSRYQVASSKERVEDDFPVLVGFMRDMVRDRDMWGSSDSLVMRTLAGTKPSRSRPSWVVSGPSSRLRGMAGQSMRRAPPASFLIHNRLAAPDLAGAAFSRREMDSPVPDNVTEETAPSAFTASPRLPRAPSITMAPGHPLLITGNSATSTPPVSLPSSVAATTSAKQALADMLSLIDMLYAHEIDRIVAWYNPNEATSVTLPDAKEFSLDSRSNVIDWRTVVRNAWHHSPKLAIMLYRRFRNAQVQVELQRFVLGNSAYVMHIPDAMSLLVNAINVRDDAPALQMLMYWAPCSFVNLLFLVSRCHAEINHAKPLFAHPVVAFFVDRCLRCFPPDVVVFYLPQLIQTLRHDEHQVVQRFLFDTAATSALVAHQLMWILITESVQDTGGHGHDKSGPSNRHGFQKQLDGADPLPAIAAELATRIEATFTPAARAFYRREFLFFDRITDISGRLLRDIRPGKTPEVTKAKRKQAIAKYLREIRASAEEAGNDYASVEPGSDESKVSEQERSLAGTAQFLGTRGDMDDMLHALYLPTNPDQQIVSVDIDSGIPMQSAAKCPFLLAFQVREFSGPDEVIRRATAQMAKRKTATRAHRSRKDKLLRGLLSRRDTVKAKTKDFATATRKATARVKAATRKQLEIVSTAAKAQWKHLQGTDDDEAHDQEAAAVAAAAEEVGTPLPPAEGAEAGGVLDAVEASNTEGDAATVDTAEGALESKREELAPGEAALATQSAEDNTDQEADAGIAEAAAVEVELDGEGDDLDGDMEGQDELSTDSDTSPSDDDGVPSDSKDGYASGSSREDHRASDKPDELATGKPVLATAADATSLETNGRRTDAHRRRRRVRPAVAAATAEVLVQRKMCIFKVYDDCRQDALALQVIQLFKMIFDQMDLGLFLYPYRVIPSRTGADKAVGGIIECVPNVKSRDELGKSGFPTLMAYFRAKYGRPDGAKFEAARRNLVRSLAAYAVVCFALQIKDRHNGNVLIDDKGHLIHIDFGFLLGTSPGGNLGFESAAFKLTREMIDVMGGEQNAEQFLYFVQLVSRAYLAAREQLDAVLALVGAMADSGLPCYRFADTLLKVQGRFHPEENDLRSCRFMRERVFDAYNKLTTIIYDGIQKLQNNIHSDSWR